MLPCVVAPELVWAISLGSPMLSSLIQAALDLAAFLLVEAKRSRAYHAFHLRVAAQRLVLAQVFDP